MGGESTLRRRSTSVSKMKSIYFSSGSHAQHRSRSASSGKVEFGTICQADYITSKGKWLQLSKMMLIVSVPVLACWSFSVASITFTAISHQELDEGRATMLRAIGLGRLINIIQKERDMSLLYVSKLGPSTVSFLLKSYDDTDETFANLWTWPSEFQNLDDDLEIFTSKTSLQLHISEYRATLVGMGTHSMLQVSTFYSEIVEFLMDWMIMRIKESGFGDNWKTLVAFQKITACLLHSGAERAYGSIFFAGGLEEDYYMHYLRRVHLYAIQYRSASYYSVVVHIDEVMGQHNLSRSILYSGSILSTLVNGSLVYIPNTTTVNASTQLDVYFGNISERMKYLSRIQEQLADRVVSLINSSMAEITTELVAYGITLICVVAEFPLIFMAVETIISRMQNYTKVLVKTSDDLSNEKDRTNCLLHLMLPGVIVERLNNSSHVGSEHFKGVTILFISIAEFSKMTMSYTASDLVKLLDVLNVGIEDHLEKYDVYKVETINDTNMVASGVPTVNGSRHASEIAYLALDLTHVLRHTILMPQSTQPAQLLLGVHTGPVSAGVVGSFMMRYCLFGETVSIANLIMKTGQPNRIQISETTYKNLKSTALFHIRERGHIDIKGKGRMRTYWLIDTLQRSLSRSSIEYNTPGDTGSMQDSGSLGTGAPSGPLPFPLATLHEQPTRSNKCVPGSNMKKKCSTAIATLPPQKLSIDKSQ